MLRSATEASGLAYPQALCVAPRVLGVVRSAGSARGLTAPAQAALCLEPPPKSIGRRSARGRGLRRVGELICGAGAAAIRNAPTPLMTDLGYGRDDVHAPDTEEGMVGLERLPDALRGHAPIDLNDHGSEAEPRSGPAARRAGQEAAQRMFEPGDLSR